MSLQDAIDSGFVTSDTSVQIDRKSGTLSLVDRSQAELVEALVAARSISEWMDKVERTLATDSELDLNNVDSLQQEISSLEVCTRKS